jgi:CubicO group peptidase (beta-lactamase class C family)
MPSRAALACWLCAVLVVLSSCTASTAPQPTPTSATPVDYAAIEAKIKSGSVGWDTIGAVMVSVEGETKIAHYRNSRTPDGALHVWSITKSVVSALIGVAIAYKIIAGLDQTLEDLLPRYKSI